MSVRYFECCQHCHNSDGRCTSRGHHPFPCEVPGCVVGGKAKP